MFLNVLSRRINIKITSFFFINVAAHYKYFLCSSGLSDGRVQTAAGLRGGVPRPAGRAAGQAPKPQPAAASSTAGEDQSEPPTAEPRPA